MIFGSDRENGEIPPFGGKRSSWYKKQLYKS